MELQEKSAHINQDYDKASEDEAAVNAYATIDAAKTCMLQSHPIYPKKPVGVPVEKRTNEKPPEPEQKKHM